LFRLFRFYTETASFGVSIEPKQTEDQPKQTETRKQYEKCLNHLKCRPFPPLFPIHTRVSRPVITNREISLYRVKRGFPAAAKLLLLLLLFIRAKGAPTCLNVFTKHMIQKYIEDDNYQLLQESILLPIEQNFGRI
jgi:hypothetical protein